MIHHRHLGREQARQILRRELTLTERVETLERKTKEHDARLDKIEYHIFTKLRKKK